MQIKSGLSEQNKKPTIDESIKVKMGKLDNLIDMVGELVIIESQVSQNSLIRDSSDPKLSQDIPQLRRIIHNVQNTAMSMRLVPIKPLFQKMIRLVRDLSKKQGKKIEMRTFGEETEIDKNIIEQISDPLMHMVRNSVDHGIEKSEVRKEKGKDETGIIELNAFHRSGNIVIELKDDGGGLNRDKILKKAKEKGLVKEGEVIPDSKIYTLILEPGFSTADKVTDVSGRGVGMDVVKRNIESLRGKIEIQSEINKGSVFSIKLPLTLAIIEGIVLRIGKESYIIPITAVAEFINPKKEDIVTVQSKGEMIKVRGELFQLIRLNNLFNVKSGVTDIEKATACIVETDYGRVAILVDEL
ncbi:chemotaxis protein CheA, partial [Candidatus Auribacterota bacterium]